MKIIYLEPAKRDLERFREFMPGNGVTEERANHIINDVIDSVRNLRNNPCLGFSIGAKHGFSTSYRGYVTDPYIVVYEVVEKTIEVRRIYHHKEDYIRNVLLIEQ